MSANKIPEDVLCWAGLSVANVKSEFPNLSDYRIRKFIYDHEEELCEAMGIAAMDYVINHILDNNDDSSEEEGSV